MLADEQRTVDGHFFADKGLTDGRLPDGEDSGEPGNYRLSEGVNGATGIYAPTGGAEHWRAAGRSSLGGEGAPDS